MSLRRLGLGRLGLLFVIACAPPLGSACSSDTSVDFDPIGGSLNGGGASGNGSGAVATGGTSANAGSSTTAGDAALGGTSQGGNGMGGTQLGGGATGTSGDAGTNAGGMAGTNGNAGSSMGGNNASGAAGTSNGGNAGTNMGGSAGTDMGGTAAAGTDMGGNAGMNGGGTAGTSMGGSAGMNGGGTSGMGGSAGTNNCTPSAEICDGIDNNCDNQIDPKGTCPDGCTGALFGGHRYMFCGTVNNISSDVAVCTGANMSTLVIESAEENAFVASKMSGDTWLGGSDAIDDGVWRWVPINHVFWNKGNIDGEYENWANGRPNLKFGNTDDCMIIQAAGGTGKWTDLSCDSGGKRAACEAVAP